MSLTQQTFDRYQPNDTLVELYGNQIRVRVCGICIQNQQILLVNHRNLTPTQVFWSPPGGGIKIGETCENALKREFLEETGLTVETKSLLFITEYIAPPLHAIELFFEVTIIKGKNIGVGFDPEMPAHQQIIQEVAWLSFEQIAQYQSSEVHGLFGHCKSLADICHLQGYIKL